MRWLVGLVVVALVAAGVGGFAVYRWWTGQAEEDRAVAAAEAFTAAWAAGDEDALAAATGGDEEAVRAHTETRARLNPDDLDTALRDVDVDQVRQGRATATYEAVWDLGALGTWTHTAELRLRRDENDERWEVAWTPTALHAGLQTGQRLQRTREWPQRAPILDTDGNVLAGPGDVVEVGVEPRAVEDGAAVAGAIDRHTAAGAEAVTELLDREDLEPAWFYPVAELPPGTEREELASVPGIVVRRTTGREITEPVLAGLLGSVGEITAEQLEEFGAPYAVGDTVGRSGIERVHERQLAGDPGHEIRIVDDEGDVVEVLHETEAVEGEEVTVTLAPDVQRAAESAMDRVGGEGTLVAVDVDGGGVLAAADRPAGGFPRWRAGGYAPGSTFKVVTAIALLSDGLAPGDPVACPATITATGRTFGNAGDLQLGEITFAEAFAESCNTAFIDAARDLPEGALADAAARLGFNTSYTVLGTPVATDLPEPGDGAAYAAQAIGQGRIDVAPVHMASVAAAAASGTWRQPHVDADAEIAEGEALQPDTVSRIAGLLREVVTDGTGTAADVAGAAVHGKTGTAEFGDGGEHAWFIGHADGVAFAVLVEGGGSGGQVAAPIAAEFVEGLP